MYTATIFSKEKQANGNLEIVVKFTDTDGTDPLFEKIQPQDREGFEYWVKSRVASLDSAKALEAEDNLNQEVTFTEPVDTRTQAEKDMALWLERDYLNEQVDKAIAKGYLTGNETKVKNLKAWLTTNFKPEYINLV